MQHTNLLQRPAHTNFPHTCPTALGSCPPLDRERTKSRVFRICRCLLPHPTIPFRYRQSRIYQLPMPPNLVAALGIPAPPLIASQMRQAEVWMWTTTTVQGLGRLCWNAIVPRIETETAIVTVSATGTETE